MTTDLNSPTIALEVRDLVKKMVLKELRKREPRWGKILDINAVDRTARVLFPNDSTPAVVKFSFYNMPTRGLNTDPAIDYDAGNVEVAEALEEEGSVQGDVVKVEGTPGNLWITDVVSSKRPWPQTTVSPEEPPTDGVPPEGSPFVPPTPQDGDVWLNPLNGKTYIWRSAGNYWDLQQDFDIQDAVTAANGKNKIFVQTATPTATAVGDTWIDAGNGNILKTWDGSAWVPKKFGNGVLAPGSLTGIEIANGAIGADQIMANAIIASKIAVGAVTANSISANAVTAGKIAASSISAGDGVIVSLSASIISTGTLNAGLVTVTNLSANSITSGTMTISSGGTTASFGGTGISMSSGTTSLSIAPNTNGFTLTQGTLTAKVFHQGLVISNTSWSGTSTLNAGYILMQAGSTRSIFLDVSSGISQIRVNNHDVAVIETGTAFISATGASSTTRAVNFTSGFKGTPNVHLSIPGQPGATGGIPRPWHVRAIAVNSSGFTIQGYSNDSSTATFNLQEVNWTALGVSSLG